MNMKNNLLVNTVEPYKYTCYELNNGMSTNNNNNNNKNVNERKNKGFSDRTFYLVVIMAMGAAIAPLGVAAAFGQTVPEEMILDNSAGLIHEDTFCQQMEAMGFNVIVFEPLDDDADRIFVYVIPGFQQISEVQG